MTLLFRIIYAAHANGTHHKLALDALRTLEDANAEKWRRLFLAHAEIYMQGAKAPDKEFKDFKNHVLHVDDDYWGGAPEKAESWYAMLVRALREENWSEAVWCAGILSHYYTDPIHPFHTAQSEAETNIHRAVEWSISKSYDSLRAGGLKGRALPLAEPVSGDDWLKDMVIAGAETSNRYYETLIANYDFARGVVEPPEGLNAVCRECIGELLVYAACGFGRILDRAFDEAGVAPPDVPLTAETVLAALKIPVKWVTRKMGDAEERRRVEAMYDELQQTGRVDETLAEDDRAIRDLYGKEVAPLRELHRQRDRTRRRETRPRPQGALPFGASHQPPLLEPMRKLQPRPEAAAPSQPGSVPAMPSEPVPQQTATPARSARTDPAKQSSPMSSVPIIQPAERVPRPGVSAPVGEAGDGPDGQQRPREVAAAETGAARAPRFHLSPEDDVEAAPSIGPRTASRLYEIGIKTVADLLSAHPEETAEKLDTRHITDDAVRDWQDQSRLVMAIPELRGTHAQLLVGAGLRNLADVAEVEPATAQAAILRFAGTREGQRILRDGTPPDLEKIAAWLENARSVRAA